MNITLTLGETCMLLISIALFILLLYCINLVRHLIPSVKSLSKVMKDAEVISEAAAKSTTSAEALVGDVLDVTDSLVTSVKGPVGMVGQATSLVAAIKIIMELISNWKNGDPNDDVEILIKESSEPTVEKETEKGGIDE